MTAFLKMHGLGNDFAVFDLRYGPIDMDPKLAKAVADRRLGIGCDQVIVIAPSPDGDEAIMRIHNADGGEVEACGNATRCVARLLMDEFRRESVTIRTPVGDLHCVNAGGGLVTVDMGKPELDWKKIPLAQDVDTNRFQFDVDGQTLEGSTLATGNPHCVLFVENAEAAPVATLGPKIEHHPLFPARVNVEFASIVSPERIRMRVWERGVGITKACGTGACATAIAAMRRGLVQRKVDVVLDGGTLTIEWTADDHILMTGPATLAYLGDVDLAALVA